MWKRFVTCVGLALAVGLLAACGDDNEGPSTPATEAPSPTAPAATEKPASPSPAPTGTTAATPSRPTPTATPAAERTVTITTEQRTSAPKTATRALPPLPASPFSEWDGTSTVIYDIQSGKELNLGPGTQRASFSPDSTKATWTVGTGFASGTEAFVIDLATGTRRSLGPARTAQFIDNRTVLAFLPGPPNDRVLIDIETGDRKPTTSGLEDFSVRFRVRDGFELVLGSNRTVDTALGPVYVFRSIVKDLSGKSVLAIEAAQISHAGGGKLWAAAPPSADGMSDVYLVDIATGQATYVVTALAGRDNWPLSAAGDLLLWTSNYCRLTGDRPSPTLFDRATGTATALTNAPDSWALFTSHGLIAFGPFGAKALFDPQTWTYVAVLPKGGDVTWSSDYRYASHGPVGGHGGYCS